MITQPTADARETRRHRLYGVTILAGTLLSVFAMAHHPAPHGASTAERLADMASLAKLSAIVHGGLIFLMLVVFFGLVGFSEVLGFHLARVRVALIAYGFGVVCLTGAALISGFISPELAERYAGASPAEIAAAEPLFVFGYRVNQTLARVGTVAYSGAIGAWSLVLVGRKRWTRAVGLLGIAVGLLPILSLLLGRLQLDVRGMLAVVVLQALWFAAIGVWLVRR